MNDINRIRKCLKVLNEECAYHKKEETREKIIKILEDNYIPKSKVKEELKKATNNEIDTSKAMFDGDFTNGYIYALQSLLGKE